MNKIIRIHIYLIIIYLPMIYGKDNNCQESKNSYNVFQQKQYDIKYPSDIILSDQTLKTPKLVKLELMHDKLSAELKLIEDGLEINKNTQHDIASLKDAKGTEDFSSALASISNYSKSSNVTMRVSSLISALDSLPKTTKDKIKKNADPLNRRILLKKHLNDYCTTIETVKNNFCNYIDDENMENNFLLAYAHLMDEGSNEKSKVDNIKAIIDNGVTEQLLQKLNNIFPEKKETFITSYSNYVNCIKDNKEKECKSKYVDNIKDSLEEYLQQLKDDLENWDYKNQNSFLPKAETLKSDLEKIDKAIKSIKEKEIYQFIQKHKLIAYHDINNNCPKPTKPNDDCKNTPRILSKGHEELTDSMGEIVKSESIPSKANLIDNISYNCSKIYSANRVKYANYKEFCETEGSNNQIAQKFIHTKDEIDNYSNNQTVFRDRNGNIERIVSNTINWKQTLNTAFSVGGVPILSAWQTEEYYSRAIPYWRQVGIIEKNWLYKTIEQDPYNYFLNPSYYHPRYYSGNDYEDIFVF